MKKILLITLLLLCLAFNKKLLAQNVAYFNGKLISLNIIDSGYKVLRPDGTLSNFNYIVLVFQNAQGQTMELKLIDSGSGIPALIVPLKVNSTVQLKVGKSYYFSLTKKCANVKDSFSDTGETFYSVFAIPQTDCSQVVLNQQNTITNNEDTTWTSNSFEFGGHLYTINVMDTDKISMPAIRAGFTED